MMTDHSPEPWGVHDVGTDMPTVCKEIDDNTCHEIAELTGCQGMSHSERVANGKRIVACVNFCKNVPTESLNHGIGVFAQAKMELNDRFMNPRVAEAIKTLKEEFA